MVVTSSLVPVDDDISISNSSNYNLNVIVSTQYQITISST